MRRQALIAACCASSLAACSPSAPNGGEKSDNDPAAAAPNYSVTCWNETYKLVLDFDKIEATPASGAVLTLPALFPMSADGVATYTDGKVSFFVKQGASQPEVSFARGKMAPTACTPG